MKTRGLLSPGEGDLESSSGEVMEVGAMSTLLQSFDDPVHGSLQSVRDWLPPVPQPSLHTYHWAFNQFRMVVVSFR